MSFCMCYAACACTLCEFPPCLTPSLFTMNPRFAYLTTDIHRWWGKPVDIELQETVLVTEAQLEQLKHPSFLNPTNPFQVTNPFTDEESQRTSAAQTTDSSGSHYDGYLITRSGLGKLLYIQLCEKRSLFSEYFKIMSIASRRLGEAGVKIRKEGLALTLIALVYGGAHLSTWNNEFPSEFEKQMWQYGSMLTAVSMGLFALSLYIGSLLRVFTKRLAKDYSKVWGFCVGFGLIPVLFARLFLLVECFLSLRGLPADSYKTVAWAETWPHIN